MEFPTGVVNDPLEANIDLFGRCGLIDDVPMPTSMSPIGTMRSRTV